MAKETILVVDDEPSIRSSVAETLRKSGFQVLEATSGTSGLRTFFEYPAGINLVLTDMIMPGMSGIEMVQNILEHSPEVKVVLMSGYRIESCEALRGKSFGFVGKPFRCTEILEKIRSQMAA